ncbi:MAG: MBL fold metallo-hydrolase [Candidatus Hodarchaeota archaeon]
MPIITGSEEILDGIHVVDFNEWGFPCLASGAIVINSRSKIAFLIDTGSSKSIDYVLKAIKSHDIELGNVIGMVPTHYHFDHAGGSASLLAKIQEYNPDFKIITRKETKEWLQHPEEHMKGAATTYGDSVGKMPFITDEEFVIIEPDKPFTLDSLFGKDFNFQYEMNLLSTPGHTPDHSSLLLSMENKKYLFSGEAAGTLFHKDKLISLPTSMPSNYSHSHFMASLDKIIPLNLDAMGFGHFGAIMGKKDITEYLNEHKKLIEWFRNEVKHLYEESNSTRHVVNEIFHVWEKRTNTLKMNRIIMENMCVGLVYGMLIDLGLKEAKYEPRVV